MIEGLTDLEERGLGVLLEAVGKLPELLQALALTTKFISKTVAASNSDLVDQLLTNLVLMRQTTKLLAEVDAVFTAVAQTDNALEKAAGQQSL